MDTEEFEQALKIVAERARHIHARVCSTQQIQVDPRNSEFTAAFDQMWKTIWKYQKEIGIKCFTITPEYGPSPYCPTMPVETGSPVYDLDIISDWQQEHLIELFRDSMN